MKDRPRKLGKSDSRKSKLIDLDELKDKAISIKDKNRGKLTSQPKRTDLSRKETPPKLGKPQEEDIFTLFSDELKKLSFIKDKKIILALIIIILIGAVGVLTANNTPTANETNNTTVTPPPPANHFDNGLISFDYPEGWNVTNGTKAPVVVTVSKDENNTFVVMNEDLGKSNFTERVDLWRQNIMQTGGVTYENNITVDNSTGYTVEASYAVNETVFNTKGIAVSKNGNIYFVMFVFKGSLLDYKDEIDMVINSFHIQ